MVHSLVSGPIRNGCIARGTIPTTEFVVVFTVPAGFGLILKNIFVTDVSGAASGWTAYVAPSTQDPLVTFAGKALAANESDAFNGWTALNENDLVFLHCSGAGLRYWCAGAVLPFAGGTAVLPLASSSIPLSELSADTAAFIRRTTPVPL